MKKHKSSRIGLNPEWFKLYIFIPISVIVALFAIIFFVHLQIKTYIQNKEIEESISESIRLEEESIKESESIKRYLQESARKEYENRQKKSNIENAEDISNDEKYKNSLLKEKWPKGTYVFNKEKDIYGVVSYCEIPIVYTKEGWSFEVDYNNFENNIVKQTGWLQWHNWTKKKEKSKYISKEEKNKIEQILKEENSLRTSNAKKIFPPNPVHGKCKYENEYYFIYNWDNGILKLRNPQIKEERYLYVEYDNTEIKQIEPNEIKKFYIMEE